MAYHGYPSGPLGEAIVKIIPKVIKTLADDGHNLIVDEVASLKTWG